MLEARNGISENRKKEWTSTRATVYIARLLLSVVLVVACQDSTGVRQPHRMRVRAPTFEDATSSQDSIHYCPQVGCRDLNDDERYALNVMLQSISRSANQYCQDMYDNLTAALTQNRIKSAAWFPTSSTQVGATDRSDWKTYIRSDLFNTSPNNGYGLWTATGHEGLHQAGYGWEPPPYDHQPVLDAMANSCFGSMA